MSWLIMVLLLVYVLPPLLSLLPEEAPEYGEGQDPSEDGKEVHAHLNVA